MNSSIITTEHPEPPSSIIKTASLPRPTAPELQRFSFTGTGSEYFRIWIVNLLLTIVTLGIYSAWAKVRRVEYFYRNTHFANSSFQYHGKPWPILKGRIVACIAIAAYFSLDQIPKGFAAAVALALLLLMPWLMMNALRFRRINASYRAIRFGFHGTLKEAYTHITPMLLMLLMPTLLTIFVDVRAASLGTIFLLGFAFAYVLFKKYALNNTTLGKSPFSFHATWQSFFGLQWKAGFLYTAVLLGIMGIGALIIGNLSVQSLASHFFKLALLGIVGYLLFLLCYAYYVTRHQSLVWNNTQLDGYTFQSNLLAMDLVKLYWKNWFLILITFGLYYPFAAIAQAQLRILSIGWKGTPESLIGALTLDSTSAVGEETADFFDFDLGL